MGQTALIVLLVVATGVALFAVQNAEPVTVRFGFWTLELSLVVVILVAAALGAVMASLVSLPGWFRDRRALRQQARELDTLRASRPAERSPALPVASAAQRPPEPPRTDPSAQGGH